MIAVPRWPPTTVSESPFALAIWSRGSQKSATHDRSAAFAAVCRRVADAGEPL